jgi:SAM-dependent methyltransferase
VHNKTTWEDAGVVSAYTGISALQAPERTIFAELGPQLAAMEVLDIGIGGGRTTEHLAGRAKRYVGIDYSRAMIDACKQRFGDSLPKASFEFGDATDMRGLEADSFDLIVFSFNGIDCVSHQDRLKVFREVHRVGRSGALFCFSTHNILSVDRLNPLREHVSRNPLRTVRQVAGWLQWHFFHRPKEPVEALRAAPYAVINDGAHDNGLYLYYVQPREQLAQLQPWFSEARVFGLASGKEITGTADIDRVTDPWIYFLCRIKPKSA